VKKTAVLSCNHATRSSAYPQSTSMPRFFRAIGDPTEKQNTY